LGVAKLATHSELIRRARCTNMMNLKGGLGLIYDKNDEIAAIWAKKESILSRNLLFIAAKRGFL
jgi:hypothetical protein